MKTGIIALVVLTALPAAADTAFDPDRTRSAYEGSIAPHIDAARSAYEKTQLRGDTHGDQSTKAAGITAAGAVAQLPVAAGRASARATALDGAAGATFAERASAAIKTDVDDAEAGLQIAPLAVFGPDTVAARSWTVTIAALKDSQFRVGTSYRRTFDSPLVGPADLGLEPCKPDWTARAKDLMALEDDVLEVCRFVNEMPPPADAKTRTAWLSALGACAIKVADLSPADKAYVDRGESADAEARLTMLATFVDDATKLSPASLSTRLLAAQVGAKRIEAVQVKAPTRTSCLNNDQISAAVVRTKWNRGEQAVGVGASATFFPFIGGFNVAPETQRSRGELATFKAHLEFQRSSRRWSQGATIGGSLGRDDADADLKPSFEAAITTDFVVCRLDGRPLLTNGELSLENGKLPPLLSLGVEMALTVPTNPDATQEKQLGDALAVDKATATLFADFRFSEDLAFRIGVPVVGEAATRKSDMRRGLVWTVPVFLTTVLKL